MSSQLDSLREFVNASGPRPHREIAHVTIVAGGKGGAGCSTIAIMLAAASARKAHSTQLIDASASGSSLDDMLAIGATSDDGMTAFDLAPNLSFVPRPAADATGGDRRSRMRRLATRYAEHRFVVIDAGASADAIAAAAAAGSGRMIAVTTADRLGMAATYALIKYTSLHFPALPVAVVANRTDLAEATAAYGRIAGGVEEFLGRPISFAGAIPEDETLLAAMEAGVSAADAQGRAAHAVELLADLLIATGTRRSGRPNLIRIT